MWVPLGLRKGGAHLCAVETVSQDPVVATEESTVWFSVKLHIFYQGTFILYILSLKFLKHASNYSPQK